LYFPHIMQIPLVSLVLFLHSLEPEVPTSLTPTLFALSFRRNGSDLKLPKLNTRMQWMDQLKWIALVSFFLAVIDPFFPPCFCRSATRLWTSGCLSLPTTKLPNEILHTW
jgi:hypothetical protein